MGDTDDVGGENLSEIINKSEGITIIEKFKPNALI